MMEQSRYDEMLRSLTRLEAGMARIEAKLDKHLGDDEDIHREQEHRLTNVEGNGKRDRSMGIVLAAVLAVASAFGLVPRQPG